jgi:hypothetical protein
VAGLELEGIRLNEGDRDGFQGAELTRTVPGDPFQNQHQFIPRLSRYGRNMQRIITSCLPRSRWVIDRTDAQEAKATLSVQCMTLRFVRRVRFVAAIRRLTALSITIAIRIQNNTSFISLLPPREALFNSHYHRHIRHGTSYLFFLTCHLNSLHNVLH